MIPGLRKKYEGKQTEFETLAEDENDERKVAIRLLTVVWAVQLINRFRLACFFFVLLVKSF